VPLLPTESALTRRDLLKGMAGLGALSAVGAPNVITAGDLASARDFAPPQPDAIRNENTRAGTRDWLLTNTRIDPATKYRCPWIE